MYAFRIIYLRTIINEFLNNIIDLLIMQIKKKRKNYYYD